MERAHSYRRIPVWKKGAYALSVLTLFFVVLEMFLFVGGVQPIRYEDDPYVGFTSYLPLFVDQTDAQGQTTMVTADNKTHLFARQQFSRHKDPDTFRVFCMGGSTTYGRPYGDSTSFCGWLRELLPEADSSRNWELINAGGISYASYRVAMLMEELASYEPDLFIIYSGQNEFLERRSYQGLIQMPDAVRGLGAITSRTRTFAVMRRMLLPSQKAGGERLPAEVSTILDDALGPDDYYRDDAMRQQVLKHYRYNLARMVEIAQSVGARVLVVTPVSNLRHCAPFKSEHQLNLSSSQRDAWRKLFAKAKQEYTDGNMAMALEHLNAAVKIESRYAELHFLRGQVLFELQHFDQALAAFKLARDEDVCPLRALSPMRQIVQEVGAEKKIPVVDFVQVLESRAEHGLPGNEHFLDHVHPTIAVNRLLAVVLIQAMEEQGMVQLTSQWGDETIQKVAQRVEVSLNATAHGVALRNLSQVLAWAGKHDEALMVARRATTMLPEDAEAFYRAGASALHSGQLDESIEFFRKALQVDSDHGRTHCKLGVALLRRDDRELARHHFEKAVSLLPDDVEARNNLGVMCEHAGNLGGAERHYEQAIRVEPDDVLAHYNLAGVLERTNHLNRAEYHYRRALELNPKFAEAYNNLGLVMERKRDMDEAQQLYSRALKLHPDYAEAHANVGTVLLFRGRHAEAIQHFQRALQLQPDYDYAREQLQRAQP